MKGWVIFDLDGTLIESEQLWGEVREAFTERHGGRWHDGAQAEMIGMRTDEWANYMRDTLGVRLDSETIARDVIAQIVERATNPVPKLPGADGALEQLSADFRLGLATSAPLVLARAVLAKTGWQARFAVVVSAEQVARGKPAPDVYLRALDLLGADTKRSAAIEDSAKGIRSAYAAQLAVVAIPNQAYPPDEAALGLTACVLSSLQELDASTIDAVLHA